MKEIDLVIDTLANATYIPYNPSESNKANTSGREESEEVRWM